MPAPSFELTKLDANTFEHLTNTLALRVLGAGHTGFGPGADGGRDGFFEGSAPYPSSKHAWSGVWYLQSKFLAPHLAKDPQKWLLERLKEELEAFQKLESKRTWPDNWIIVTNIEPSGAPQTGSFDRARAMVRKARPALAKRFHIWSGRKVLDLLALYPEIGGLETAPKLTRHGLPLIKCEAYKTVSMTNPTDCVEIITSVQRRRRWTACEKVRMVEETFSRA